MYNKRGEINYKTGQSCHEQTFLWLVGNSIIEFCQSIDSELTHALVQYLPIPAWLNEGIAVNIENSIMGSSSYGMDDKLYNRHKSFWGVDEIQEFFSGKSFHRADEGQELSYHLAQFFVHSLSDDYETFVNFVKKASYTDGGKSAAYEIYEDGLGELINQLFGEGDWSSNPEHWIE